jgi:hypothetical protein
VEENYYFASPSKSFFFAWPERAGAASLDCLRIIKMEGKQAEDDVFEEGKEAAEPEEYTIVNKAIEYCTSHKFEDMIDDFGREHAHVFEDALEAKSDDIEHKLEYSTLHHEYMKLFEARIEGWILCTRDISSYTNNDAFDHRIHRPRRVDDS